VVPAAYNCTVAPVIADLPLTTVPLTMNAMVKVAADDVPPVSVTVTFAEPAVAIRLAGTAAVTWVALTNVVVSAVPSQFTIALESKFVPFTVRVNATPPGAAEGGERLVIAGVAGLIVNTFGPDVPAASVTVMFTEPAVARRLAGTVAVRLVVLTNVVVNAVLPHCTVAPETKFVPVTVRVNAALPAVTESEERPVIVGAPGALIVNDAPKDAPAESVTVTVAEPVVAIRLAGTVAVRLVALTNVVVNAVPFHCTVAPETKFVPVTVKVKSEPPASADAGERLPIVGTAELMAKAAAADVPPASVTVTFAEPVVAIRLAGTAAVRLVALTKVVVNAVPFHCTVAPETKFVPVTVSENAAPPAIAEEGERLAMVGGAALMVKVEPGDVPPELVTVTLAEPGVASRLAGTTAVNCVALTKVLARAVVPHCTVVPASKFVPVIVKVTAPLPAGAEEGARLVIVGGRATGEIVNVAPADVPPGVITVTFAEPAVAIRLAGTAAVSWVALPKVVVSAVLPHCTVAPETKFVPLTVKVNAAPPAAAVAGERLAIIGALALLMV
jgi:hypothetical protein